MTGRMDEKAVLEIDLGGADALAASAVFHQYHLPRAVALLAEGHDSIVLQFEYAPEKPHRWRREAVAALARAAVPARVNGVAPASSMLDAAAMRATIGFLHANGGVTGQLLLAGEIAGEIDGHVGGHVGGAVGGAVGGEIAGELGGE